MGLSGAFQQKGGIINGVTVALASPAVLGQAAL